MQLQGFTLLTLLVTSSQALPSLLKERTTCSNAGISANRAAQVSSAFSSAKLTPQVIPSFTPKVEVNAAYGSKTVNLGNTFSVAETVSSPTITFTGETDHDAATTKYAIVFIDPDAPGPTADGTPAALSPFLHLAVYNASPSCITSANYGGGTTLAMYKPLTPLSVAKHRYTQLVYRQSPNFVPPPSLSYVTGSNFDLKAFVAAGLTLVGGNFFLEGL